MTSVSEVSIDYLFGDVLTSIQLQLSFQEQLLFEKKERDKSIELNIIFEKTFNLNVISQIVSSLLLAAILF